MGDPAGSVATAAAQALARLDRDVDGTVLFAALSGSHAYGTAHANSDVDIRGLYAAPMDQLIGLGRPQEQYDFDEPDVVVFEAGKFVRLAVAANPNVMDVLYSPAVHTHPSMAMLLDQRDVLLSAKIRATYGGFANNQMRYVRERSEAGRLQPGRRTKHLMHCFRVLEQATDTLRTGTVNVTVADPERLWTLASSSDDVVLAEFQRRLDVLETVPTRLPDQPDEAVVNDLLVALRRDLT